jgi:hypothetical protein
MRKYLNNPKVVGVLAVAAVGFVGYSIASEMGMFDRSFSNEPAAEALASPDPGASTQDPAALALKEALDSVVLTAAVRDPFAVKVVDTIKAEEQQPESFTEDTAHVSAVWSQAGRTLVLLNGRVMSAGEVAGRFTVESASTDGAWLTHWKGRDFVAVGQRFVLQTPAGRLASVANN